MTLDPLLAAAPVIQIHTAAALVALALSVPQLLMRKGGRRHRILGYLWVAAMLLTAGISFLITTKGTFSWIHLLSVLTLVMVPWGVVKARQGRVREHSIRMAALVALALVVTGLFTLMPGRIMHDVVFGHGVATVRAGALQVYDK